MSPQTYLESVLLRRERVTTWDEHPFSVPAIRHLDSLAFHPQVTFFIGENGTGKSTLLEAIAVLEGFNPEGGTRNYNFATCDTHSRTLPQAMQLRRCVNRGLAREGFFFRAESYYNVLTYHDKSVYDKHDRPKYRLGPPGVSPHEISHGESFMALVTQRLFRAGLYLFDEPEAALSPQRQLVLLARMRQLIDQGSQLIIATHSPIIMAYPDAWIYSFSDRGIERVAYEDTDHYKITRAFLTRTEKMLEELFSAR